MFWGLIMEPGKRYTQKVERAFHVSMACLEPSSADNENVSVMLSFDKTEFILCNLNKHKVIQTQLDLNFQSGDKIAFMSSGKGRVHLTGYLLETDDDDEEDDEDDEEKDMTNGMSVDSVDSFTKKASNTSKESGKRKNEPQLSKPESKKAKLEQPESDEDKSLDMDDDDDDDDDEDDDELGESDDMLEGSEDEDDDDDDDEEDEDEDSESEDEKMVSISKQKPESKKNKTMSPKEMQPNKSLIKQNKSPNEKEQKSGFFNEKHQKAKTPNEKQQQQQQKQKIKTPNEKLQTSTPKSSPGAQVNGIQSGKKNKKGFDTPKGAKTPNAESPQKKVLEGGVMVEDVRVGNGPVAKPGRQVSVYYVGRLRNNNKQFDSTTEGSGFKFRLGRGEVIKGWDIGVSGMKVGGKRKIVCPPALAYGNKGSPPAIPPNSTLVFEVELKSVN